MVEFAVKDSQKLKKIQRVQTLRVYSSRAAKNARHWKRRVQATADEERWSDEKQAQVGVVYRGSALRVERGGHSEVLRREGGEFVHNTDFEGQFRVFEGNCFWFGGERGEFREGVEVEWGDDGWQAVENKVGGSETGWLIDGWFNLWNLI